MLLWPAYCRALIGLQAQGINPEDAQRRAADRVTLHHVERVALPRRFSLPMQEIWLLQTRFSTRQKRRVTRLLAHPRFRAAYDFLLLRLAASPEHAEDVEFWREAQTQSGDELAATLGVAQPHDSYTAEEDALPSKRRRRRRRRSGAASPTE